MSQPPDADPPPAPENPYEAPKTTGRLQRTRRRSRRPARDHAGFFARAVAFIIDGVITNGLVIVAGLILIPGFDIVQQNEDPDALYTVMSLLIPILYTIPFWLHSGATPGKMVLAIKIVDARGEPPGLGACVLRYIGYVISGLLCLIGYLWMLWDDDNQCLHDKMAGTYVVKR